MTARSPAAALVVLLVLAPIFLAAAGCGSAPTPSAAKSRSGECAYPDSGQPAARKVDPPPGSPSTTKPSQVVVSTNRGTIKVTLDPTHAPCTVNSFLSLAKQGYFDDTPCHRLTTANIYVLQCGSPDGSPSGGPGYSFTSEVLPDDPRIQPCRREQTQDGPQQVCVFPAGTVAMANSGEDTNGSQFFLVYRDSRLPNAYPVFGRMDATGLSVVRSVAAKGAQPPDQYGNTAPTERVQITSVR